MCQMINWHMLISLDVLRVLSDVCGSGVANSCRSMGLCWSGICRQPGRNPPARVGSCNHPQGESARLYHAVPSLKQLGGSRLDLLGEVAITCYNWANDGELASNQIWWTLKRQTQFRNTTLDTFEKLVMETCWNLNLQACCCLCVCVCVLWSIITEIL